MNGRALVASLLTALTLSCQGDATDSEVAPNPAKALAETESRVITSAITGRTYEISVAFPRGYKKSDMLYPALYAVDANSQFGMIVETARLLAWEGNPELLVVGIGYPVGRGWNAVGPRAVDLTPTPDQEAIERIHEKYPEFPALEGSGGAPGFLRFILEELIPLIETEYKASPDGRGLYGHSFGGLFSAYALFHGEGAFDRFIVGSPSLGWDNRVTFQFEEEYAEDHDSLEARVFISVGGLEEPFFPVGGLEEREEDPQAAQYAAVSNVREFSQVLRGRQYEGLSQQFHVFEDETHLSVIPATISRGLRFVYGPQE